VRANSPCIAAQRMMRAAHIQVEVPNADTAVVDMSTKMLAIT
jgi:hypothetical protein